MKDVFILRDLDQIKCISQAYRISILESFEEKPATAKMISEKLNEPHAKINYHLKEMLKYGIINLVEEVVKLGIVEKFYLPVAKQFIVDSKMMKITDAEVQESINQYRLSIFDKVSDTFYESASNKETSQDLKMRMLYDLYLTEEQIEDFHQEVNKIFNKYKDLEKKTALTNRYMIAHLVIPELNGEKI